MKPAALALAIALTGCGATSSYQREHEIDANLPRAMGLGAFAPACLILCFPSATFTHGDDTIDPNAAEALTHSRMKLQSETQGGITTKSPTPKGPQP